jgi:ABC-2 type transport system permease protein
LSIAIGVAGVVATVWLSAKIFRIGLLMFGKPPDFKTLVKWVRAA